MFIKHLTISSRSREIRKITFQKGLNLIVDETPSVDGKETGNSVGKTTVLMLIDFCLGASPKQIYTDPEGKRDEYKLVKDFLISNEVVVTLVLAEALSVDGSRETEIQRNFLARKNIIRKIDGVHYTEDEFEEKLTDLLFPGHYGKKPTFPQIISHNIRYSDLSLTNTLKTLDRYTRDDEYEALYLFLLGCNFQDGDERQQLIAKIRVEEAFKARLEKEQTKSAYEAALSIIDSDLTRLNGKKSSLNLNRDFEANIQELNAIRYKKGVVGSEMGRLRIRRDLILAAESELQAGTSKMDVRQLKILYEQAVKHVDGIHKKFSDLVEFHNRMVEEKVRYVKQELPDIDRRLKALKENMREASSLEDSLVAKISQSDSFSDMENLIAEINEKHRTKGELDAKLQQLDEVLANLQTLGRRINEIDDLLFSVEFSQKIQDQVNKFNVHFSEVSFFLYGERYALKFDPFVDRAGRKIYRFSAFNTNFSSGKKQGEISCFDIAYTRFADSEGIPCFHFLLNDKKELMHGNQLLKISQLVESSEIQFVASILSDKLPEELKTDEHVVLRLSQGNKLFRIEASSD